MTLTLNNFKGCLKWHFFFALLFSFQLQASTYLVNKEHSKLKFKVKYMALTDVEGQFDDYKIFFEKKDQKITSLQGEIDVKSINTFDKKRDQHLKKKDFFDLKNYPLIKFKATGPIDLNSKEAQAKIELIIKDKKKIVPVMIKYLGERKDPWTNKDGSYYQGSFKINRFDFGINWSKKFDAGLVVGEEVEINFVIEAYESNDKPAFSRFYLPTNSVQREVELDTKTTGGELILPENYKKKEQSPKYDSKKDYSNFSNISLTLISTALLFAFTIIIGILAQSRLVTWLERKGVSDKYTLLISSIIVTAFIVVVFYITSDYTGVGVHPFFKR